MKNITIAIVVMFTLLISCIDKSEVSTTVKGKVINWVTKQPMPNAIIKIERHSNGTISGSGDEVIHTFKTDLNGEFDETLLLPNNEWYTIEYDYWNNVGSSLNYGTNISSLTNVLNLNSNLFDFKGSQFKVGNHFQVQANGNVMIDGDLTLNSGAFRITDGSANQYAIYSDGNVRAREIKVDLQPIPDYVFAPDYELMPLTDLRLFIAQNNHLPNIKSEKEYEEDGEISLTELNLKLLEKVEELTLYTLQQQEDINALKAEIKKLKN